MNAEELKSRISNLSIWKRGDERAPHKPLLILHALGRLQSSNTRLLPYEEVRETLTGLLKDFGPPRKSYHPEQPFCRLSKDGIWQHNIELKEYKNNWLLNNGISGGFNDDTYTLLVNDKNLVREVAELILDQHFTYTLHEDILTAVGLNIESNTRKIRDPKFRDKILRAYEYSCAICGFNVRLGRNLVGIEAAHIKWHQHGGPDREENGVALCSMHHKLFDYGAFTINPSMEIIVSEEAHGTNGFEEWLMRFHGKNLHKPINPLYQPNDTFVIWHINEVFKGPGRYGVG